MPLRRMQASRGPTLLDRYSEQFGLLIERSATLSALEAARHEAETKEKQARSAAAAATVANETLLREINRRLETQTRLAHLATHDPLTGLGNRVLLAEQLERAIDTVKRAGQSLALLYLDLDHFKDVNDTLGHAAGDGLLRTVSQRLEGCLRGDAMVARLGGDEFALFVGDLDAAGASALAQRIITTLADPIAIAGHRVFVGVSIGVTIYPEDGDTVGALMSNGDVAMYRAKQEGRNCYQLFDKTLNQAVRRRATLEQALHEAVPLEQVAVVYQPQVHLATGRIVGFEALLRWTHPDHGAVLPDEFVPIAEGSGLINNLGAWILHESCRQVVAWGQAGLPPVRVLGQLFRFPPDGKPLCTLDLSGVSSELLNVVVAVLCRLAFNLAVSMGKGVPLLVICEEAHRYAPQDIGLGFQPARRSLERIAREGRQYGIGLGVLSDRPSQLARSILSHCRTMIAFRMTSDADQDMVQAAVPDIPPALVSSLPLLGDGEAVIVGDGVAVPMRLRLTQLPPDRRPRSNSASFSRLWQPAASVDATP